MFKEIKEKTPIGDGTSYSFKDIDRKNLEIKEKTPIGDGNYALTDLFQLFSIDKKKDPDRGRKLPINFIIMLIGKR